jgi:putative FmdB family regulatory protein
MPVYVYKCQKCKDIVEVTQKITDKALSSHIQLNSKCSGTLVRQMCPPAFVFKGTGFYATDYKKKEKETKKE